MLTIVPENERRHYTYDELMKMIPDHYIAIENPDELYTGVTGGVLVAYCADYDSIDEKQKLMTMIHESNCLHYIDTFNMEGLFLF